MQLYVSYPCYYPLKDGRFTATCPVNILVVSADGSRVGYDWSTNTTVNEIDGATYSGQGTDPQVITIPSPPSGVYTVDIYGTGNGFYTVTLIQSRKTIQSRARPRGRAQPH